MKKVFTLIFCLFVVVSVCSARETMLSDNSKIVGGYTKAAVDSKDVTDALSYGVRFTGGTGMLFRLDLRGRKPSGM